MSRTLGATDSQPIPSWANTSWWFHCNICSIKPDGTGTANRLSEFLLSECFHIFCRSCLDRFQKQPDICPLCKCQAGFEKVTEIAGEHNYLFEPPVRLVKSTLVTLNLACKQSELLVRHLNAHIQRNRQQIQNNEARSEIIKEELKAIAQRKAKGHLFQPVNYEFQKKAAHPGDFLNLPDCPERDFNSVLAPVSGLFFDTSLNNSSGLPGVTRLRCKPLARQNKPLGL